MVYDPGEVRIYRKKDSRLLFENLRYFGIPRLGFDISFHSLLPVGWDDRADDPASATAFQKLHVAAVGSSYWRGSAVNWGSGVSAF